LRLDALAVSSEVGGGPAVGYVVIADAGRLARPEANVSLLYEGRRGGDAEEEERDAGVDEVAPVAVPVATGQPDERPRERLAGHNLARARPAPELLSHHPEHERDQAEHEQRRDAVRRVRGCQQPPQ